MWWSRLCRYSSCPLLWEGVRDLSAWLSKTERVVNVRSCNKQTKEVPQYQKEGEKKKPFFSAVGGELMLDISKNGIVVIIGKTDFRWALILCYLFSLVFIVVWHI